MARMPNSRILVSPPMVWLIAALGTSWQAFAIWQNWPLPLHAEPFPTLGLIPVVCLLILAYLRVSSGKQTQLALDDASESKRRLLNRLLTVEEEERHKIAGELHDDTIQSMAAALLMIDAARRDAVTPSVIANLERSQSLLRGALDRTRQLMFEMAPAVLNHPGLCPALEQVTKAAADELGATYDYDCGNERFEPATEHMIFRATRECLVNVRKHSKATHVSVKVARHHRRLVVAVADNGQGFDYEAARERSKGRQVYRHLGLAAMVERIELTGGNVSVDSHPGQTQVTMVVPVKQRKVVAAD